ncbi:hypothetical protein LTR64_007976 [Lithohypha guttulata]|uniref:uncharacterized protein n=1 Tax=Lithohypha guttulata TaxID=1690604 RepID=UPI002DDE0228|nr:Ribosome biogenesis protein [Lithohypha guttulata]
MAHVFSPNHIELMAFFGIREEPFNSIVIDSLATAFLRLRVGESNKGIVVIRAGEHGSLSMQMGRSLHWQRPYYASDSDNSSSKIVDTTGAGKAFLGGLAMGYLKSRDHVEASHYGAAVASFMLEQVGLPSLTYDEVTEKELWNNDNPYRRLESLED